MQTNTKRYMIVMICCVVLNEVLSSLVAIFNLPLWLDMVGTALAALLLEPTAGLIVGYFNNFFIAVFRFDASSIIYFAVSASVAILVGVLLKNKKQVNMKKILMTIGLVILVTSVLSCILTLWRSGGISNLVWEKYFFDIARSYQLPIWLSCFIGALCVKIPDILVSAVLVGVIYVILPAKLKNHKEKKVHHKEQMEEAQCQEQ